MVEKVYISTEYLIVSEEKSIIKLGASTRLYEDMNKMRPGYWTIQLRASYASGRKIEKIS